MELNGLLGFEHTCEHLVSLDVLVEYLVPGCVGAPGTIKGVLGLETNQMGRNIYTIAGRHEPVDLIGVSAGALEQARQILWFAVAVGCLIGRGGGKERGLILFYLIYREKLLHIGTNASVEGLGVEEFATGQGRLARIGHLRGLVEVQSGFISTIDRGYIPLQLVGIL